MDEVIFHGMFPDPPTYYDKKNHKIKVNDKGVVIPYDRHYLTANLWYSADMHFSLKYKIIDFAKAWLMQYMANIPKIEKCQLTVTYHHPTDTFDLDNKVYFWTKLILDIMKTPTSKQIIKAQQYDNVIKTIESLKDDTVRFVDGINMKYKKGEAAIELKITGRLESTQQNLFQ